MFLNIEQQPIELVVLNLVIKQIYDLVLLYLRFCVGDRFYLFENKILCEYDYEERMVFASLPQTISSLDHIKKQTKELGMNMNSVNVNVNSMNVNVNANVEVCDGSSGYGSGDSPYEQ